MVGERAPLTSGCSGTSILAFLPDQEVDEIIRTHAKSTQRRKLATLVDRIRDDGYAASFSSNHVGLNGISAPLLDPETDLPLGSVAIAGPVERLPEATLHSSSRRCSRPAPRWRRVWQRSLDPTLRYTWESLDVHIQHFLDA